MKFPLEHEPFPPLTLSDAQRVHYDRLSQALLHEMLDEYDDFVFTNNRVLSKKRWKEVKSRENVKIYKSTVGGSTPTVSVDATIGPTPHTVEWRVPKVIGVGTIVGTLDDVMYGVFAPDDNALKIKGAYLQNKLADWRVLDAIHKSTEDEPFRYLGIKWSIVSQMMQKVGVKPRDLVFLEATGTTRLRSTGERVGYVMYHSVDMPHCPELKHLGIVRGRISTCFLYKQADRGSVELYMRSFVDFGGSSAPDVVAVIASATTLIAACKMTVCAQNKKLGWLLREARMMRAPTMSYMHSKQHRDDLFVKARADDATSCPLCMKTVSAFRTFMQCDICYGTMCSRCVTMRKLMDIDPAGNLVKLRTGICKNCVTKATRMNAADLAVIEHVHGHEGHRIRVQSGEHSDLFDTGSRRRASGRQTFGSSGSEYTATPRTTRDSFTSVADALMEGGTDEESDLPIMPYAAPATPVDPQRQMWERMNQLRIAVEETYRVTKKNARIMQQFT